MINILIHIWFPSVGNRNKYFKHLMLHKIRDSCLHISDISPSTRECFGLKRIHNYFQSRERALWIFHVNVSRDRAGREQERVSVCESVCEREREALT